MTLWNYILQNHLSERDPGHARDVPGAPWDPRDPLGSLGTPLGPPGKPLGPPGRPHHKNGHISTNIRRQKLSIAVFEPACCDPSLEGLPKAFLC